MHKTLKLFTTVVLGAFAATSIADDSASQLAKPVALVELFTSQGCYSCPAADDVLTNYFAPREDVAALELHVDYWDDLVYGGSVWADPFSNAQYTRRQTDYNIKIRDTRTIYTPQTVIHGQRQASGTQKDRIELAVRESLQAEPDVRFRFLSDNNGKQGVVKLEGPIQPGAQLFYATFWKHRSTDVTAGENKNKTMINTNVVTDLQQLSYNGRQVNIPAIDEGQGCAIWLQLGRAGRVLSAARCPQS
ncbi:MAG: DUF1223 domain-containing protein [Gammaproteobacteria bacterium WSBS_2016_MAG_OTU1]